MSPTNTFCPSLPISYFVLSPSISHSLQIHSSPLSLSLPRSMSLPPLYSLFLSHIPLASIHSPLSLKSHFQLLTLYLFRTYSTPNSALKLHFPSPPVAHHVLIPFISPHSSFQHPSKPLTLSHPY
jgi:hypothetical protein